MMQELPPTSRILHIAALVFLLAFSVHGTPNIDLPINAQVPPIARPNEAYNFVFSDSTFSWAGNSITYSLTNYSGWLHLDSSSRVFSGTPGSADAGSFAVVLVATDETGSSSTSVTFVVSTDPGPELGISVGEQLPAFGPVSSPDSLSIAPSSTLSLSFSPNTFTNTNVNTVYYAICANNTPLPSWVNFDPSRLTFSGTTPSSTSPWESPQAFRIQLIASNVLGFAEAVASFQLIIASHLLVFSNSLHVINIKNGTPVEFPGLQHDLTLDGHPANPSDIRQAAASTPTWMSFNSSDLILSGIPPSNAASQNFTVTVTDIYGDTASTLVLVQDLGNLTTSFLGPFPIANATIGANFTYNLSPELSSKLPSDVAVNLGAASVWLKYDSSSLELQGHIPTDVQPQSIQVMVTTTLGSQSQAQNLTIDIQHASSSNAQTTGSHSVPPKSISTTGVNQSVDTTSSASKHGKRWIAAPVVVPVSVALGCLLLLCFCLKRRRRRRANRIYPHTPRLKISRVIQEKNPSDVEVPGILSANENRATLRASRTSWLDVLGFQTSGQSNRASRLRLSHDNISSVEQSTKLDSGAYLFPARAKDRLAPEVSQISEKRTPQKLRKTSQGHNAPQAAVQRLSIIADTSPNKRNSKHRQQRSRLSYDTTSVFSSQRLSGIGHGRNTQSRSSSNPAFSNKGVGHGNGLIGGPSGFGIVRNSWRNLSRSTWASTDGSSDQGTEEDATIGSLHSNARPPMPKLSIKRSHSHVIHEVSDDEGPRKPTLRPVLSHTKRRIRRQSDSSSHSSKADPLQTFHKRRLQQRSSRNPLFSAGPSSSRISSLRVSKIIPFQRSISPSDNTGDNIVPGHPITPQRERTRRSYSESSSLDPPVRPSPSKSSNTPTSPRRQKSYIKYQLKTRALSPPRFNRPSRMNSRGSSWVSTSSDSKFGSAASEATPPFHGFGEDLREEMDEDGNKRWLRGHPNPLGTHRLDVTDQELIDSLRISGQVSPAQRLSYLMRAHAEGKPDLGTESVDEGGEQVKIGSTRGKRLGQSAGLRQGDPGNMSMRGDIGNTTAGSAFI